MAHRKRRIVAKPKSDRLPGAAGLQGRKLETLDDVRGVRAKA
jgi:hypothetical protein